MSICSTAAPPNQDAPSLTITGVDGLKPLLVPAVVAFQLLGVRTTKGWSLIKEKRLEAVHVGKRCCIVVASIERLVEELRENARANEPRRGLAEATAASVASRRHTKNAPPKRKLVRPREEAARRGAVAR